VNALAFHPNGLAMAAGFGDGSIRFYDLAHGTGSAPVRTIKAGARAATGRLPSACLG